MILFQLFYNNILRTNLSKKIKILMSHAMLTTVICSLIVRRCVALSGLYICKMVILEYSVSKSTVSLLGASVGYFFGL